MRIQSQHWQKLYRLELDDRGCVAPRLIEFEAHGRECVLTAIARSGTGRAVSVFEEGAPLVRVQPMANGGSWWVNPPRLRPL